MTAPMVQTQTQTQTNIRAEAEAAGLDLTGAAERVVMIRKEARQGDVLLQSVRSLAGTAANTRALATGRESHWIVGDADIISRDGATVGIMARGPWALLHPEHDGIMGGAGCWQYYPQRVASPSDLSERKTLD